MDIHPPTGRIESIKAYLVHLSMVVFGILIALGLDGWRESRREHTLVEHSIAAMRIEIEANKEQLQRALDGSEKVRDALRKVIEVIEAAIQRKQRKQTTAIHGSERYGFNFDAPTLTAGAWQAAIATQALAHMDYMKAQLWSSLYADQDDLRTFQNELVSVVGRFFVMGSLSDSEDIARLQQRRDLARELRNRLEVMQQNWRSLLTHYDAVLSASGQ